MNIEELSALENEKGLDTMIYEGTPEEQDYAYNRLREMESGEGQQLPPTEDVENIQQQTQIPSQEQELTQIQQPVGHQTSSVNTDNQNVETNVFTTTYMGKEVSMPDPDGYMNRSDLNGLKNAFVHNNNYINTLKAQMEEKDNLARSEIEKFAKEKEQLAKEREELAKQLELFKSQQSQFQNSAQTQSYQHQSYQQPSQNSSYDNTTQMQNNQYQQNSYSPLPSDIMEWEDQQVSLLNNNLGKIPTFEEKLKTIENELTQYKTQIQQQEEMKRRLEEERIAKENEKRYFDEVNGFVKENSYFSELGSDILEYDSMASNWMDNIAMANGIYKPYTNDPNAITDYESKKIEVAQRYMNGDPIVMSKTSHIEKPRGIEKFYEFSNLLKKRDEHYKLSNGTPMSLNDVWVLEQNRNGNLQNGVHNAVNNAYREGAQAMANVQGEVANHAVNLPNNASQSNESEVDVTSMTQDELEKIIYSDPVRRMQNPTLQKQFQAVSKYLNSVSG